MKVIIGVIIFTFSVIPARAQFSSTSCPPWFTFGCYQTQSAPSRAEPRHRRVRQETEPRRQEQRVRHRGNDREHSRGNDRRENDRKPTVTTIHKVVRRPVRSSGEDNTWNGLSQDKAREWITKQANGFCNKFPTDKACHRVEQEEKKE